MIDSKLRLTKDELLSGPADGIAKFATANQLTSLGLVLTLAAAGSAASSHMYMALSLWLAGRVADGLDGAVARARGEADDLGGYTDLIADTIGYAAIPFGIAIGIGNSATWVAAAVLLASFYINSVSWLLLSAIYEKRGSGATASKELTTVTMPPALIEGAETIVFFALFLAFSAQAQLLFLVMAGAVLVGVLRRFVIARSTLASLDRS